MTDGESLPVARLREQAERVRRLWQALGVEGRELLRVRLGVDPLDQAWSAVIDGRHPMRDWLDGDDTWPPSPMQPSARQLITSHPLSGRKPWSNPAT